MIRRRIRLAMREDRGDTLIEVLIAVAIVAITAAALIGTVLMSITASSEHRSLAVNDTVLKSYAAEAQNMIQRQANFQTSCPASYVVSLPAGLPTGYTAGISAIQYWDGTSFTSVCTPNAVQLITVTVTSPTQVSSSLSFAVRDPR